MTRGQFKPAEAERGTALLTVLLLVAVMATVAATIMDRLGVGIRVAANASVLAQARAWLGTAELLAMTRIEDMLAANPSQTILANSMLGKPRTITLPDGGKVTASVTDGSNCFNLNSLVEQRDGRRLARPSAQRQFAALMRLVGIAGGEAERIALAATDYINSGEGGAGGASSLFLDGSELRAVAGVRPRNYRQVERWICALPTTDLSAINVNTLLPDEAVLLAMLAPESIDLPRARTQIESRPIDGFGSVVAFWNSPALRGIDAPPEVAQQIRVRTEFFKLSATVTAGSLDLGETALIDARKAQAQIVWRRWGSAS